MASDAKKYRITTPADFLLVPEDRLLACLEEFVDWLKVTRRTDALLRTLAPDHPTDQPIVRVGSFVWCDDGKRDITMNLRDGAGGGVRVEFPENGSPSAHITTEAK